MDILSNMYKNNDLYRLAKSRAIKTRNKYGLRSGPVNVPVFDF